MSQPIMHVTTLISPPIFSLKEAVEKDNFPTITLTVTLEHTQPITLYTWPTIFNLSLATIRHNFFCVDLETDEHLRLDTLHQGHRGGGISCQLGSYDDQYWVTFYPGEPLTFTERFRITPMTWNRDPLIPGHRYRYGIDRRWLNGVERWVDGKTREDIMTTEKQYYRGPYAEAKLIYAGGDIVEIEVME